MIRQQSCRARQLGLSVVALHPHFELASLRMVLFLAFTFIFVTPFGGLSCFELNCENGASCIEGSGKCTCDVGFKGNKCEGG